MPSPKPSDGVTHQQLLREIVDTFEPLADEDLNSYNLNDLLADALLLYQKAKALLPPSIIITVEGGVVQSVANLPPGMTAYVHDYTDSPGTQKDDQGDRFEKLGPWTSDD